MRNFVNEIDDFELCDSASEYRLALKLNPLVVSSSKRDVWFSLACSEAEL